eukprot:1319473-Amorphochlora_amoeboformis.AAC.1
MKIHDLNKENLRHLRKPRGFCRVSLDLVNLLVADISQRRIETKRERERGTAREERGKERGRDSTKTEDEIGKRCSNKC